MKAIILAAGYATRLYPLTKNKPKPLLSIGDTTILDYLIEKIDKVQVIDGIYIVTNDKFYPHFSEWKSTYFGSKELVVINDETTSNDNRLGAIADIQYVIEHADIRDDLLVLAGDNLFDFELTDFVDIFDQVKQDCIAVFEFEDYEELQQTGVVTVDAESNIQSFVEKPDEPKSNLAVPPCYLYRQDTLPLILDYLNEGNNPDAPGNFIPWLIKHRQVKAYKFHGRSYDIGTLESYEKIKKVYDKEK